MTIFDSIQKPTLLLDEKVARQNIQKIIQPLRDSGVRFRPHFKTHQSAEIGEWFRSEGVTAITVSSLQMAEYFMAHSWQDITIAFPVNIRQVTTINAIATRIKLGILVESPETVRFLDKNLKTTVNAWIKIDTGNGRTGLPWQDATPVLALAKEIESSKNIHFAGLLNHAGQTYKSDAKDKVCEAYLESLVRLNTIKDLLEKKGFMGIETSTGDTPAASLCSPGRVDELRPGNFIFYDAMQHQIGSCVEAEIAVALACPVVALHPDRNEIIFHGGAIHLSSDFITENDVRVYGKVALPDGNRWGRFLDGAFVRSLSQEHGVARVIPSDMDRIKVGDIICVIPAHSCLTAHLMREYLTLEGRTIRTMNS